MGRITFSNILSCESVIAGAFFPQFYFQVPEEEVGQHTGQYMRVNLNKTVEAKK
jgi:hypothetical protein